MSTFQRALGTGKAREQELGGQMSFLEHLDELRLSSEEFTRLKLFRKQSFQHLLDNAR